MQFGIIAESDYICTSVPVNKEAASGCSDGGIGRHEGLKIPWAVMSVRVRFPLPVSLYRLTGISFIWYVDVWKIGTYPGRCPDHDLLRHVMVI